MEKKPDFLKRLFLRLFKIGEFESTDQNSGNSKSFCPDQTCTNTRKTQRCKMPYDVDIEARFNEAGKLPQGSIALVTTPESGYSDLYDRLKETLKKAFAEQKKIVLDLQNAYVDSYVTLEPVFREFAQRWPREFGNIWDVISFSDNVPPPTIYFIETIVNSELYKPYENDPQMLGKKIDEVFST
ncbi:MAG: hypothetical protein R3F28_12805 [Candidatus Kapaibacterium sp.]|nr:hypothetical protein [Ignavibacteria bacterium]